MWLTQRGEGESKLPHPALRQLYTYWTERAVDDRIPSRADIDPLDFPLLLANVALIDVERDVAGGEARYRYRVYGTALAERAGRDLTGRCFEEAFEPAEIRDDLEIYGKLVETGIPYYSHRHIPDPEREYIGYERLILPLASDRRTIDKILLLVIFD